VGDDRRGVAERLIAQRAAAGGLQVDELLRREDQADPRRARAAEQPRDALGRYRGELIDRDERWDRAGLQARDE
jgi:hypothetical protein